MAGNGTNFETFDEIFVLPWHKLHAALYWYPETAKSKPLYSAFCCHYVWKLHFLGILFQIIRFSRSFVEWYKYNLYNTMRMKTIRSMKCVKLDTFTLAAFTRPFMDVYRGIGWKIGESFGCWTKPLAQYMSEIETTRTVDENIIHYTWFVEPVLVLILWRTFSGLAQSFFSRLTKAGLIKLRSWSFSKQLQFKSKQNETYSRPWGKKIWGIFKDFDGFL